MAPHNQHNKQHLCYDPLPMSDPYHFPFMRRQNTMYLSTIGKQEFSAPQRYERQSSFQMNDIAGTKPKVHIPQHVEGNYSLSTFVEPVPDRASNLRKRSDPLFIDDIQGSRPRVSHFRTKRVVDPLCPKYVLPSPAEIVPDNGRSFIRDTLQVTDIAGKRIRTLQKPKKEPIDGSSPSQRFRQVHGVSRLQVKDINKDGVFESKRNTDPQQPEYHWRDNHEKQLNLSYGAISGTHPQQMHPSTVARHNNYCLGIKDIEGTQAGSFFSRSHFVDKRREFRNYMQIQDIEKATASSLKKGIETERQTNPLMPKYQFPGRSSLS